MRPIAIMLVLLILLTGCAGAAETAATMHPPTEQVTEPAAEPSAESLPEPSETEPAQQRYVLTFAGDCTLGCQDQVRGATMSFDSTVGEDYGWPFRNVQDWFQNDDFTFVNLEGVLGAMDAYPRGQFHSLRGPEEFVSVLTQGGVEGVTLANNHTKDFGADGYESTLSVLETAGVPYVQAHGTLLYTTPSGLTIGIYADGYADMHMDRVEEAVAQLREAGAQVIVYSVHWGQELSYYPEDYQIDWAHRAMDAGVDILYGTHPHVLQLFEIYNGKPIFYSLGNFAFGGHTQPRDLDSAFAQVEVIRDADGTVRLGETTLIPVCCSSDPPVNNYQPTPYEEGTEDYQRVMDKLAGLWRWK